MKLFRQLSSGMVLLTIVAICTIASAYDGHNHGSTLGMNSPTYDQTRPSTIRDPYQPVTGPYQLNDVASRGCAVGGCCSGPGGCSATSGDLAASGNSFTRVVASTPDELEQLSVRMESIVRDELRGAREYNNLVADAGDVVRSAQRLRQADAGRAPADVMLEEARTMLTPLQRMNAALKNDGQAPDSLGAVQDVGRLLVAYGRDLQSVVSGPAPVDRELLPPRPSISNSDHNSGVSIPAEMKGVALLPASEQAAALRQRTCPVIGEPLGSMGKPIRVDVAGRSIYVCCEGCVNAVRRNPEKYMTTGSNSPNLQSHPMEQDRYPAIPSSSLLGSPATSIPEEMKGVALLPISEQGAALRQRTCPVNGEPLGSMGKPIRVDVSDRSVYVCCAGCVNAVQRNPEKYLRQ